MCVGFLMTGEAIRADVFVRSRDMALLARNGDMQPYEWEVREVMVEARSAAAPPFGRMALRTVGAELAGMHVACPVARDAGRLQVLSRNRRRVAGVALHLLVPALQRPLRVLRVIEAGGLPALVVVAVVAALAQAAGMRILPPVAAIAVFRNRVVEAPAAVTIRAVDAVVSSLEREACLFGVVELRGLPARRRMTVRALRAALAAVNVVRRVTGNALTRRAVVAIAEVAREAGGLAMLVPQREVRVVVIERDVAPDRRIVAARAITAELAVVRFLFAVA